MMKQMMTVICSATLAACGSAPFVQPQSEYQVMTISTTDKELQTIYSAAIRGRQDIDIYPQVSGTLTKLCVEEGQTVRRGQVLFIIDQVPYLAASAHSRSQCGSCPCRRGHFATDIMTAEGALCPEGDFRV